MAYSWVMCLLNKTYFSFSIRLHSKGFSYTTFSESFEEIAGCKSPTCTLSHLSITSTSVDSVALQVPVPENECNRFDVVHFPETHFQCLIQLSACDVVLAF